MGADAECRKSELLKQKAYHITPSNLKADLEKMLFGQCNVAWIDHESHRLLGMLEAAAGVTLPSGGVIIADVFGAYPQLGWKRLVQEFLQSA